MDVVDEADDGDKIFKDPDDVVRGDGKLAITAGSDIERGRWRPANSSDSKIALESDGCQ